MTAADQVPSRCGGGRASCSERTVLMRRSLLLVQPVSITLLLAVLVGCSRVPAALRSTTILFHDAAGLWRMAPDGSKLIQLTDFGWFAEYSPDNSQIAFGEFYENGIWVANADGTDPLRLTASGSAPAWSPDGSRLAFHGGGTAGAGRHIWIMNADGTSVRRLSRTNGSFPSWSPQGDKILFHGEVNSGIWLISPDSSEEILLDREGGYPAWSPDGTEIAYVDLEDWCVWVMNADGTGKRKLTDHGGILPTWSPDGSQIAYEVSQREDAGIWVINADGSGDHRISPQGGTAEATPVDDTPAQRKHPDWSN
jgi:Tol biopolymer transport system component